VKNLCLASLREAMFIDILLDDFGSTKTASPDSEIEATLTDFQHF
jgi:hypothetical protein